MINYFKTNLKRYIVVLLTIIIFVGAAVIVSLLTGYNLHTILTCLLVGLVANLFYDVNKLEITERDNKSD